jgi:hypothetical protein
VVVEGVHWTESPECRKGPSSKLEEVLYILLRMHRKSRLNTLELCYTLSIVHCKSLHSDGDVNLFHTLGIAWCDAGSNLEFDPNDDGWYG